ncbi:unnamed protein product [Paramecium primaurelia]|uniref:Uncharacterized protein n=1 Tax=Paramecium primaurelia TaxID=5886 RepID=A0A8S1JXB8_PARPR|nr:unnamed protein product [Paramecium primaurelia]
MLRNLDENGYFTIFEERLKYEVFFEMLIDDMNMIRFKFIIIQSSHI